MNINQINNVKKIISLATFLKKIYISLGCIKYIVKK